MGLKQLQQTIWEIGEEIVACKVGCEGIACRQADNILPRCLILETKGRAARVGSIIVGINPGRSTHREHQFYKENGRTYDQVVQYWEMHIRNDGRYHRKLRILTDQLGRTGPILWTELAKCENAGQRRGSPPLQALRFCTDRYLKREVKVMPNSWPFLAAGYETFKALAYLYPERAVLGIPHPASSRGHFHQLSTNGRLKPEIQDVCLDAMQSRKAVWLRFPI